MKRNHVFFTLLLFSCCLWFTTANALERYYLSTEWEEETVTSNSVWGIDAADPTCCTIVTTDSTIKNSGNRSLKVTLKNPDQVVAYKRAEISSRHKAVMGEQYFYRFSTYLPDPGFPQNNDDSSTWTLITQWHGPPDFDLGETWRSPTLAFQINEAGNLDVVLRYAKEQVNTPVQATTIHFDEVDIPKNQWITFEVSVKWTYTDSGYLDIWMDGTNIVSYTGPTSYNDAEGPYMKMGIYRAPTIQEEETVYFDNLQILRNGIIVFPDADTYVQGGSYESTNYGSETSLLVKHNLPQIVLNREAYLHFDYSRFADYDFNSGSLYVQPCYLGDIAGALYLDMVDNNWEEEVLTYLSAQNLTTLATEGSTTISSDPFEVAVPDVPSYNEISLHAYLDVFNAMLFFRSREYDTITERPMLFLELE